jgi:hypothetical protein
MTTFLEIISLSLSVWMLETLINAGLQELKPRQNSLNCKCTAYREKVPPAILMENGWSTNSKSKRDSEEA